MYCAVGTPTGSRLRKGLLSNRGRVVFSFCVFCAPPAPPSRWPCHAVLSLGCAEPAPHDPSRLCSTWPHTAAFYLSCTDSSSAVSVSSSCSIRQSAIHRKTPTNGCFTLGSDYYTRTSSTLLEHTGKVHTEILHCAVVRHGCPAQ